MMDEMILNKALLELQEYLVEQFPEPTEEDFRLPLRFRNKMRQLLEKHDHPYWYYFKKTVAVVILLLVLFGGVTLGFNENARANVWEWIVERFPVFARDAVRIPLVEGYHEFSMDYSENGIFYYVQTVDSGMHYDFYFQPYSGKKNGACVFEKEGGYMRDLSAIKKADGLHYCILWVDENAGYLSEYDQSGKLYVEYVLTDQGFEAPGRFPILQALSNGGYLIGMESEVYLIRPDGSLHHTLSVGEGVIRNLVAMENGRCFAVYQDFPGTVMSIAEIDFEEGRILGGRNLPTFDERVSVFAKDRLAVCTNDHAWLLDMDGNRDEKLIDLKKKNIVAMQVQGIYGNTENLTLVSVDSDGDEMKIRALHLSGDVDSSQQGTLKGVEGNITEKYAADGRRIIRVAVSGEEEHPWIVEYRARKYSQESDSVVIEVERFDGNPEEYLASGEQPDIVMLLDQTDIAPLVEKGLLADLNPLCEMQDKYSIKDLLPKVREALSVDGGLYALAKSFRLLVYASNGEELDGEGKCTALEYLRWYDAYLDQNGVEGMGNMKSLFHVVLPEFYDEETGRADFESEEFRELMQEYGKLYGKHAGELASFDSADESNLEKIIESKIARGPMWVGMLLTESQLMDPSVRLSGIPTCSGVPVTSLLLERPYAILEASDCKEEALDFILYACRTKTHEYYTSGGTYGERPEGEMQTEGYFWAFEDYLNEDIFETGKDLCWVLHYSQKAGEKFNGIVQEITEEHKEMMRDLMDHSVNITKTQADIYEMFLEESAGYLDGCRDLEAFIESLQNRVCLYLEVRR